MLTNREAGVDRAEAQFNEHQQGGYDRYGVAGAYGGLRAVPQPQVRPDQPEGVLPAVCVRIGLEENDIDAQMPGEMGPYLKSRPGYDKERRTCSRNTGRPRNRPNGRAR